MSRAGSGRSRTSSTQEQQPRKFGRHHRPLNPITENPPRHNKIYRTPPTPPPDILLEKEKTFTLDCMAASSISTDYSRVNPKLGPVVPPYNGQNDKHTQNYYHFQDIDKTLKRTDQFGERASSIEGRVMDSFHARGPGHEYLTLRNQFGAGHSRELVDGHAQFMRGIKPAIGYHGLFGYRRNTPWLRATPSPFGLATRSSIH